MPGKKLKETPKGVFQTLREVLGTMVNEETITPIPLLAAQEDRKEALRLEKGKKKEAMQMIDAANTELKKSVLLGYSDENSKEYTYLKSEIEKVRQGMEGETHLEKTYDELKSSFSNVIQKAKSESHKFLSASKHN